MRLLLSCLLCLLFVPTYAGDDRLPLYRPPLDITIRPVALDASNPARRKLGALTFLEGYVLEAPDPAFGGFSSMIVRGDHFLMLSDGGNYIDFHLDHGKLSRLTYGAVPDGPGSGWDKIDRDSESMAIDPATGQLWVGYETWNQIWRYAPGFRRAEAHSAPPAMAGWAQNLGAESLVRLGDGHFLTIHEREERESEPRLGLVFAHDPTIDPRHGFAFRYRPPEGFDPTDAAELPNGDLIVLNRHFRCCRFTSAVTVINRASIRSGALVTSHEIARFEPPVVHDNFEAVAIQREGKQVVIWIAADDNQQWWEKSYLLKFRLDLPAAGVPGGKSASSP